MREIPTNFGWVNIYKDGRPCKKCGMWTVLDGFPRQLYHTGVYHIAGTCRRCQTEDKMGKRDPDRLGRGEAKELAEYVRPMASQELRKIFDSAFTGLSRRATM